MIDKRKRRIPKRIGGVKIPKDVRKHGEKLIDALIDHATSPAGRQAMFEAMGGVTQAAMQAMAAEFWGAGPFGRPPSEARTPPRRPPPPIPPESVTPPRPPVPPMPPAGAMREPDWEAIGDQLGRGVEQVMGRLFGGNRGR